MAPTSSSIIAPSEEATLWIVNQHRRCISEEDHTSPPAVSVRWGPCAFKGYDASGTPVYVQDVTRKSSSSSSGDSCSSKELLQTVPLPGAVHIEFTFEPTDLADDMFKHIYRVFEKAENEDQDCLIQPTSVHKPLIERVRGELLFEFVERFMDIETLNAGIEMRYNAIRTELMEMGVHNTDDLMRPKYHKVPDAWYEWATRRVPGMFVVSCHHHTELFHELAASGWLHHMFPQWYYDVLTDSSSP